MSDGRISEIGTYAELLNSEAGFAEFVENYIEEAVSESVEGFHS